MGNPYKDCLKKEIELLNLSETYLPIKISAFQNGMNINSIIHESYQHYISSLEKDTDIVLEEVALLDININSTNRRYDNIINEIKSLRELLKINQENLRKYLHILIMKLLIRHGYLWLR